MVVGKRRENKPIRAGADQKSDPKRGIIVFAE
jgi:hypothetical protein